MALEPTSMPDAPEGFEELHQDVFLQSQRALAERIAAKYLQERTGVLQEAMTVAERAIDLANEMATHGDPHKARLATIIKDSVIGALSEVMNGTAPSSGGRRAVEVTPFSENSTSSAQSLESPTSKQLGYEELQESPKRRGRPPKKTKG